MGTSVNLTPTPMQRFVDSNGNALSGGKLFTYQAGTTTKAATYTDSTGNTPNTNPIVLNQRGEASIWLVPTQAYKFVLSPSNDTDPPTSPIWTQDNIIAPVSVAVGNMTDEKGSGGQPGFVNGVDFTAGTTTTLTLSQNYGAAANLWVAFDAAEQGPDTYSLSGTTLTFTAAIPVGTNKVYVKGGTSLTVGTPSPGTVTDQSVAAGANIQSSKIGYNEGGAGAITRTLLSRLSDLVSVKDFGAKGDGSTDDTAAINAADAAASSQGRLLIFPGGTYMVNSGGITRNGCSWMGSGSSVSILKSTASSYANNTGMVTGTGLTGFYTEGIGFDISQGVFPPGSGNPGNIMWAVAFVNCNQWEFSKCSVTGIQPHTIGLATNGCNDFTIENNYFNMPNPTGTAFNQAINISASSNPTSRNRVVKNTMIGSALNSAGTPGLFSQNVVSGWGFGGGLTFGPNSNQTELVISDNVCQNSLAVIDINNTAISGIECWTAYSIISRNVCNNNSGSGITIGATQTTCSDNICFNNGQGSQGGNGITAYSTSNANNASQCVISNNNCFDNQGTKTQGYGYYESQGVGFNILYNTLTDNNLNGNKTGTMFLAGSTEEISFRGPQIAVSGVAASPGTLTAGATANQVVSVNGAALGDIVKVGFSQDLQGVSLFGYVSSAGTVTVFFSNNNGVGTKTLTAGVINILVEKPLNYSSLS